MQVRSDLNRLLPIPARLSRLPTSSTVDKTARGNQITEPWTSVEDVARHLGVAKDSIYRWIDRRSLPAHRIGRLWKFKISEVDDWVRAGGADSDRLETKK